MYLSSKLSVNIHGQIIHVSQLDRPLSQDYQFFLMQEGTAEVRFPDTREVWQLNPKDLIMIPPNANISCAASGANTMLAVRIDAQYLDSQIPANFEICCNSVKNGENAGAFQSLSDVVYRICSALYNRQGALWLSSMVYELTALLLDQFLVSKSTDGELLLRADQNQVRIRQIRDYLEAHYHQDISLQSLSEELSLSAQYLSRFFKKSFGISFKAYLNNLRLEHALTQLISTKNSITDIALDNGFSNVTTFIPLFSKRYSMPPGRYRQEHSRLSQDMPHPADLPRQEMVLSDRAEFVDVTLTSEYAKPWQQGINVGAFANTLRNSFHECLSEYSRDISVQYVRFSDLFAPDVLPYDSAIDEFDFSSVDVILQFLKRKQIYPFVELTYKPRKGTTVLWGSQPDTLFENEKSTQYYCHALRALLEHCINNLGIDYVKGWKFEVWYKYGEDLMPRESPEEYMDRYLQYSSTIRGIVPECKIGGPGFNICGDIQLFRNLLQNLEQAGLPMDYITFSAFTYQLRDQDELAAPEEPTTLGIISPDPDHIVNTFRSYLALVRQSEGYGDVPCLITELGVILSQNNHISSSLFPATFLCKNMLALMNCCDGVFYNYFMDVKQGGSPQKSGRNYVGLVHENGIPKPALHAYRFLNLLGRHLICKGDGFVLTRNSPNRYQLLCYNYTHFNRTFCFNSWGSVEVDETYGIFEEGTPRSIHLGCSRVPSGKYKVTQYSLDHSHGSILDKYLRILERGNISRMDLSTMIANFREDESDYYRRTCLPLQDIYFLNVEENLTIDVTLEPHAVHFYDFTRIL